MKTLTDVSADIWVDLDATLIASNERPNPCWIEFRQGVYGYCRPGARECLQRLRQIARCRLLTYAGMSYAAAANDTFSLGFGRTEILAQEHWTSLFAPVPSLGRTQDVLIENESSSTAAAKTAFIGIGLDRVIIVPDYTGAVADHALLVVPASAQVLLFPPPGVSTGPNIASS